MKKNLLHSAKNTFLRSHKTLLIFGILIISVIITTIYVQQSNEFRQQAQTLVTPPTASVDIVDFEFTPKVLTITAGTTVTWTNRSTTGVPHTSTSDTSTGQNAWDSPILSPGDSFAKTFNNVGTFNYHCNVHGAAMMSAVIIVVPAPTSPTTIKNPTPTPTPTHTPTPSPTPAPTLPIYCLGSCPTPTPTPSPTPNYPTTPIPTDEYETSTTPPSPTPTIPPCPADYDYSSSSVTSQDNEVSTTTYRHGHRHGHQQPRENIMRQLFQFLMDLILKLLELLFGINIPTPSPVPSPTSGPNPTDGANIYPTNAPAPTYVMGPTNELEPSGSLLPTSPIYYPTPTKPYNYPTPTQTYNYPTPTPPCIPPSNNPEPSNNEEDPTPTISPTDNPTATPTPYGQRSVETLKYVPGNEPLKTFDLVAEVVGNKWLFNGQWPGPPLHVKQGDHVQVNVKNNLPEGLSVHWHGIRTPAAEDGVPGVTQDAIKPQASQQYNFVVPDSGTYWYHSHQNTSHQLPKGLYGALIVDPSHETVHYDRDYSIVYRNSDNPIPEQLEANPGEKVRIRLINSRVGDSAGNPLKIAPVGLPYKVVALDGQDIHEPQEITSAQIIEIGFAQRYDLEFNMPASGSAQLEDFDGIQRITIGPETVTPPDGLNTLPVFDFMSYGTPTEDVYLPHTNYDKEETLTIGPNFTINGQLSPLVPDMIFKKGEVILVHYVNESAMTHPMHIHGHFYSVIKKNGVAPSGSPIHLDTILLHPGETADVAIYANDPGVWMLHCHILSHAAAGLSMLVKYDDVYTPFSMKHDSGNIPE